MVSFSSYLKLLQQPVFLSASNVWKLCKLPFQTIEQREESHPVVEYIYTSLKEGDIVFDIGTKENYYLYLFRKRLGKSGRIIAFQSRPHVLQQLKHLKKIFRWKNVEMEPLIFSDISCLSTVYNYVNATNNASLHGAIVVDINNNEDDRVANEIRVETLDNYCEENNITPCFLKIDAGGNELKMLKGAINTLRNYKPKILLKCDERLAGTQNVLETFAYLHQLNYRGYFVLDTILIPVTNFDFNIYQNTSNNFYCNCFMFQ